MTLAWAGLGVDANTTIVEVVAIRRSDGLQAVLADGLPSVGQLSWDSTTIADGFYDLRAVFRNSSLQVIGTTVLPGRSVNNSALWHSGQLTADETWSAGAIHIVERDLTVMTGKTLHIEPGVIVKFTPDTRLIVEDGGILDAAGEVTLPVIMTSLADDTAGGDTNLDGLNTLPVPGGWDGLVKQGSGQLNLNEHVSLR